MRVLVTGANGHLGYNLVAELLAAGHAVRGSVRSLADSAKAERVKRLGAVELVEAELGQADRLRAAMEGIEVLFHTAAVYSLADPARDAETLRASGAGLEAALRAAADARVRKVVLTSSVVAVPLTAPGAPPSTEDDWADAERIVPYVRAKTDGERRAWALARELGLNLATMLPGAIGGPGFVRNTPSIDVLEVMMRGGFRLGVPDFNFAYIDVRDVASAHRLAGERDVDGRFIVVGDESPSFRELIEAMHAVDPRVKLPLARMPDWVLPAAGLFDRLNALTLGTPRTVSREVVRMLRGRRYNASNRRARELLGWSPRIGLRESLKDTMDTLRARGPQ